THCADLLSRAIQPDQLAFRVSRSISEQAESRSGSADSELTEIPGDLPGHEHGFTNWCQRLEVQLLCYKRTLAMEEHIVRRGKHGKGIRADHAVAFLRVERASVDSSDFRRAVYEKQKVLAVREERRPQVTRLLRCFDARHFRRGAASRWYAVQR